VGSCFWFWARYDLQANVHSPQSSRFSLSGKYLPKEDIEKSKAELQNQSGTLAQQREALTQQQAQVTAQQEKIAANKAAVDATMKRFGQLDDYYILDEVTVYFGNGKVDLDPKFKPDLERLVTRAKSFQGYMIELKGYASSAGSTSLNQRLSDDRAENVANFLIQECHLPSTNLLAPAAMSESQQIYDDKTAEAHAKTRRVVVRTLQNKGIVGPTGGGF
jgi:outer membrane protein OmpA-like peptidoglycan-associated protein